MSETSSPELTPAYRLFHLYYGCMIPAPYAYEKHHRLVGSVKYESAQAEQIASEEMVSRQHTVVELIKYHERGAAIILTNPKDAVTIYYDLRDHLVQMREKMRYNVNHQTAPLDDLRAMDEFARVVYRIARQYETGVPAQGNLTRRMDDMFGQRRKIRRLAVQERKEADATKEKYPDGKPVKEHDSISDDISREALERGLPQSR
jgi:hypothetical protein